MLESKIGKDEEFVISGAGNQGVVVVPTIKLQPFFSW
jgi:hypothetical protein